MDRLTERVEDSVRIKNCKTLYSSNERKNAPASSAIARLAAYEDSGLTPDEVQALVNERKNEPLTLEELKNMDGLPVWLDFDGEDGEWVLVQEDSEYGVVIVHKNTIPAAYRFIANCGGKFYKHKPKE